MKSVIVLSLFCFATVKSFTSNSLQDTSEEDDDNIRKPIENIHEINIKARNGEELTAEIGDVPVEVRSGGTHSNDLRILPEQEKNVRRALTESYDESEAEKDEQDKETQDEKSASEEKIPEREAVKNIKPNDDIQSTINKHQFESSESKERQSKEKEDLDEIGSIGGHRHRNDPNAEKSREFVFSFETIDVDSMERAAYSNADEDNSGMSFSRRGLADILRGTRRMLHNDLIRKKLEIKNENNDSPLSFDGLGGSRTSPSSLVSSLQSKLPLFNQQLLTDNAAINLRDRFAFNDRLDPEFNSYPYAAATLRSNLGSRLFGDHISNAVTHPLSSHLPGLFNLFEKSFSPIKHTIHGGRFEA